MKLVFFVAIITVFFKSNALDLKEINGTENTNSKLFSAKQDAFLDNNTKEAMQKYENKYFIPINPDSDVSFSVGNQQIQVNIKY